MSESVTSHRRWADVVAPCALASPLHHSCAAALHKHQAGCAALLEASLLACPCLPAPHLSAEVPACLLPSLPSPPGCAAAELLTTPEIICRAWDSSMNTQPNTFTWWVCLPPHLPLHACCLSLHLLASAARAPQPATLRAAIGCLPGPLASRTAL